MLKAVSIALLFAACVTACISQETPMHPCKAEEQGECAIQPKIARDIEPEYSDYGRRKKINGTVELTFTVLPDGTTSDIVVSRSLEKSLDQQAVKAVRQWRFEPGTYQGEPVAVRISAAATFRIY